MRLFGFITGDRFPWVMRASQHDLSFDVTRKRGGVAEAGDLSGRAVPSDPLGDWFWGLPDLISPQQVTMILRGGLAGNLWTFSQLVQKMSDSWPTFRKSLNELRTAVRMVKFKVSPACEEGDEPTDSAVDKSKFVQRCFKSFEPDRFKDEDAFGGMVYDLTDAVAIGISIVELMWAEAREGTVSPDGKPESRVRASAWVNPRHYSVKPDGGIGVAEESRVDDLAFRSMIAKATMDVPEKFLVARYKGKSGSCLGAGEARCLAMCWVNIAFAVDWIRNCGQKYGTPFMAIPYTPGIPESERVKFEQAAKLAAALGALVYPQQNPAQKVEVYPAQPMSADNPIRVMVDLAEKWCVQLLLGQTLTTDTADGGKGGSSYALGEVHAGVKQEKLSAIASWIAEILQTQLATVLLKLNWGDASECPTVEADFTRKEAPMEAAQRMGVLTSQVRVPFVADEVYKTVGMRMPRPGDEVVANGVISVQPEPKTEEEKFDQQLDQQVQQAEASMELQAEAQPQEQDSFAASDRAGLERTVGRNIRAVLAAAGAEDLDAVEKLYVKAKAEGGNNGAWKEVNIKLGQVAEKNRIKFYEQGE